MRGEKLGGMPPCPSIVPTPWHPPVGVFIGILGLLGVLVPLLREKIGAIEKVVWTVTLTACLLLELRSIRLDQIQHDREQDFALCQQIHNFQSIADTLSKVSDTNQEQYEATMKQVGKVLDTTQKNLDSVSGTKSYAYILPEVTKSGYQYALSITNGGPNVLTGIEVRISKIISGDCDFFAKMTKPTKPGKYTMGCTFDDGPMHPMAVGSLAGFETIQMPGMIDVGPDGAAKYEILITAQNGNSIEIVRFRKSKEGAGCAFSISVSRSLSVGRNATHYSVPIKQIDWTEPTQ